MLGLRPALDLSTYLNGDLIYSRIIDNIPIRFIVLVT